MADRKLTEDTIRGLYCLIDTTYVAPADIAVTGQALLDAGAHVVQLRAKGDGGSELLASARTLRELTARSGAKLIINDRVDIALLSGADGVHLGLDDLPVDAARRLLGPASIIGASTHNLEEARSALKLGADYLSFGPVFPTRTKKDADSVKGVEMLAAYKAEIKAPVVAIGGITAANMAGVFAAGAESVAIISDILCSDDPGRRAADIISRIH